MAARMSRVTQFLVQLTSAEEASLDEVQEHVCRDCLKYEDRPTMTVTRAQTDQILRDRPSSRGYILSLPMTPLQ